jgi:hypothetical protein
VKGIQLTRGYVALIDDEDFERVSKHRWRAHVSLHTVYARRNTKKNGYIWLHRFILGVSQKVDHRDGNGLDNQKSNLRRATSSRNCANARKRPGISRFRGVTRARDKWQAYLTKDNKRIYLGVFKDEVDAATAYNFAAEIYHGEFARFNTCQGR